MKTSEVTARYHITRQTISNWEKYGNLKTKRTGTNRLVWDEESIGWLENYIKQKDDAINLKYSDADFVRIQNRRYLGAKSRMLDFIEKIIDENTVEVNSFADIFGGTGVVADRFFKKGINVVVNDLLDSNYFSYLTYFGSEEVDDNKIKKHIEKMNALSLHNNYVSNNYGGKYFSENNAKKIGEAREYIENLKDINKREYAILLTSLVYAMDKSANTVGHYDAYRRKMDTLAPIIFKLPKYNRRKITKANLYHEDANQLVRHLKADLVYIDPPYNSRQYGDIYHVLENIVDWKKPELFGVAMKPKDRSKTKSRYCTTKAPEVFEDLISNIKANYILVSYNNMAQKGSGRSNAKISNDEIVSILSKRGKVTIFSEDFQVFTTGKTNIEGHKELLYLVEVTK